MQNPESLPAPEQESLELERAYAWAKGILDTDAINPRNFKDRDPVKVAQHLAYVAEIEKDRVFAAIARIPGTGVQLF